MCIRHILCIIITYIYITTDTITIRIFLLNKYDDNYKKENLKNIGISIINKN